MIVQRLSLVGILLALFMIVGCAGNQVLGAGNASSTGGGAAAFEGVYDSAYSRDGTMTIGVTAAGRVSVVVNDAADGLFAGTGNLNSNNTFSVTCRRGDGATLTVQGTFAGSGAGRRASGTTAGRFTISYDATFSSNPTLNAFANHYESVSDTRLGPGRFDVDANGYISGMMGNFTMTGSLDRTGYATGDYKSSSTGPVVGHFAGHFRITATGIRVRGWYAIDGLGNGTWEGGDSHG